MLHPTERPGYVKPGLIRRLYGDPSRPTSPAKNAGSHAAETPPDGISVLQFVAVAGPDFRSAAWTINGEVRQFYFTRLQADVFRMLYEAWSKSKLPVSIGYIMENLDTDRDNPSIRGLFPRGHPAMGTLIVNVGKGLWTLANPS
jgi:hypothetical protein